ncbi:MAG: diphthine--ammonia ligase [archaeon]|nr:diphthine--ammonia ligase [archaeon]
MEKVLVCWSGGKDSALALQEIQKQGFEIVALLTTLTEDYDRISMHGVRRELLEQQAEALGIPLEKVFIKKDSSCEDYSKKMEDAMNKYTSLEVTLVCFGDLFLQDIREYREAQLKQTRAKPIFPLWKKDTKKLAEQFIDSNFKAIITCVDSEKLGKEFVGKEFNQEFLNDLPEGTDWCGENGEFHSFVYAGPIFKKPLEFKKGEIVLRDNRFYFCDLV